LSAIAFFSFAGYEVYLSREQPFTLSSDETLVFAQDANQQPPAPVVDAAPHQEPAAQPLIDWATNDTSMWLWVGQYELLVSKIVYDGDA